MTGGRAWLVTYKGETYHEPRPCYLLTEQEAAETAMALRVTYGEAYGTVKTDAGPFCESHHPYNCSHCERAHGHAGEHWYTEPLDGKRRTW